MSWMLSHVDPPKSPVATRWRQMLRLPVAHIHRFHLNFQGNLPFPPSDTLHCPHPDFDFFKSKTAGSSPAPSTPRASNTSTYFSQKDVDSIKLSLRNIATWMQDVPEREFMFPSDLRGILHSVATILVHTQHCGWDQVPCNDKGMSLTAFVNYLYPASVPHGSGSAAHGTADISGSMDIDTHPPPTQAPAAPALGGHPKPKPKAEPKPKPKAELIKCPPPPSHPANCSYMQAAATPTPAVESVVAIV